MATRYSRQAGYIALLVLGTGALLVVMADTGVNWPPLTVWVFAITCFLFVWHFGVTAPSLGLVSLERVPQFGFLLVFDPVVAALLNAAAALIYPFTNAHYRQGSLKVGALRALHNAAMTALMLITAGAVYWAFGGDHPLQDLGLDDLTPLVAAALAAQLVNHAMLVIFYRLDGRDPSRIFTPMYAFGVCTGAG